MAGNLAETPAAVGGRRTSCFKPEAYTLSPKSNIGMIRMLVLKTYSFIRSQANSCCTGVGRRSHTLRSRKQDRALAPDCEFQTKAPDLLERQYKSVLSGWENYKTSRKAHPPVRVWTRR